MSNKLKAGSRIACCPVCGASDLKALVIVPATQNDDGVWEIQSDIDDETLQDECNNVNQEVMCSNPYCGNPLDDNNAVVPLNGQPEFDYWKKMLALPEDTTFESLDKEMQEQFTEWSSSLRYFPWVGALGDCVDFYGKKISEE